MSRIVHGTLAANTVATVTLDQAYSTIEVLNRSGSAEIYFRLDGTSPTVAGVDCQVVPAVIGSVSARGISLGPTSLVSTTGSVVKLISNGTPTYTVSGTL